MKSHSILANTAFLSIGNMVGRFFGLVASIYIIRDLGPDNYGKYAFVLSVVTVGSVFWEFGLNTLLTRDVSNNRSLATPYLGNIIRIKLIFTVIVAILTLIYLRLACYDYATLLSVVIFTAATSVMSVVGAYGSAFSAFRRMDFVALQNISRSSMFALAILLVLVFFKLDVIEVFGAHLVASLVVLVVSIMINNRHFEKTQSAINWGKQLDLVRKSMAFVTINIVSVMLWKIDHLMLSKISGDRELGYYGAAYTIIELVISFIPLMLVNSAFPVISEKWKTNKEEVRTIFNTLGKYLLFFGIPIAAGLVILGERVSVVLFSKSYEKAGVILSLLGGSVCVFFITVLIGWCLTAMENQRAVLVSTTIALFINVGLNLILMPLYGAYGAAISNIVSELGQLFFMTIAICRVITVDFHKAVPRMLLPLFLMIATICFIQHIATAETDSVPALALIIAAGLFVYLGSSILLKSVNLKELSVLAKH